MISKNIFFQNVNYIVVTDNSAKIYKFNVYGYYFKAACYYNVFP